MSTKRKSPDESATLFSIGKTKIGNDGNKWIVVQTTNGIKRWKPFKNTDKNILTKEYSHLPDKYIAKKISSNNGKTFFTHDNGGRPFRIIHSSKNKTVSIYKTPRKLTDEEFESNDFGKFYTKLIKTYNNIQKFFIGKDYSGYGMNGNSILIHLSNNKYVFIGEKIYEFSTLNNDEQIVSYFSNVGNNDVPYPIALSKDNVYFMLDAEYIPRERFKANTPWADAYMAYYGHAYTDNKEGLDQYAKKVKKFKSIHNRV